MQQEGKGKIVRINNQAKVLLEEMVKITGQSRGDIMLDSLNMINAELKKTDYNYSKIIEKYRGE